MKHQLRCAERPGGSSLAPYCWWKKSCTSWYGKCPIIYKVLCIPGGAGFLPSTVFWRDFRYPQLQIAPFRSHQLVKHLLKFFLFRAWHGNTVNSCYLTWNCLPGWFRWKFGNQSNQMGEASQIFRGHPNRNNRIPCEILHLHRKISNEIFENPNGEKIYAKQGGRSVKRSSRQPDIFGCPTHQTNMYHKSRLPQQCLNMSQPNVCLQLLATNVNDFFVKHDFFPWS